MTLNLTATDLAFFKENGYLIKRQVLNSDLMAQARERMWAAAPAPLRRDDPTTWVGPFAEPVLVMTSDAFQAEKLRNITDDVLIKPVRISDLREMVLCLMAKSAQTS